VNIFMADMNVSCWR